MKKVGKEFKKTLSAILVAAMVFTSLPQTTLVAKAEEADQQQTVDVSEYAEVGGDESRTVYPDFVVVDKAGNVLNDVEASAKVQTDETYYYVQNVVLKDAKGATLSYPIESVGGDETTDDIEDFDGYVFTKPADGKAITVVVDKKETTYTVTVPGTATGADAVNYYVGNTEKTPADNKIADLKAGDTLTVKVTAAKPVSGKNTLTYQIVDSAAETVTEATTEDGKDVFTFDITITKDVTISSITVTTSNVYKVTVADNAEVKGIKYGKTADTATVPIPAAGADVAADSDYYFAVELADAAKTKIIKSVTYGSTPLTKVSDNVFKLAKGITADGALTVVTEATAATVTLDCDANVTVSYKVGEAGYVTATGTKISLPADTASIKVKAKVKDATKYMLSEYNVTGVADDTVKLSAGTDETEELTVTLKDNAGSFAVKSEALAYDYTIDWPTGDAYTVQITSEYVKEVSGNGTDFIGNKNVQAADKVDKTVRVLPGKELTFTVKSNDETKKITNVASDKGTVTKKVDESGNTYYAIKSESTSNGAVITAAPAEITAENVTFDFTSAANIKKITADVDKSTGKPTTEVAKKFTKEAADINSKSVDVPVYPGTDLKVVIEMEDSKHIVSAVEYVLEDGTKCKEENVSTIVLTSDVLSKISGNIKVTTAENDAVKNTANFVYNTTDANVTVSGAVLNKDKTAATMLPNDDNTASADGNSFTFDVMAESGYEITGITVGDKEIDVTKGTTGITVDFGKEEKTDDKGAKSYVANSAQTVNVVITTKAPENKNDKRFAITSTDDALISYKVTTAGVESYSKTTGTSTKSTTTYYDVAGDAAIDEVEFEVNVKAGYELNTIANTFVKKVSSDGNTSTYKIIVKDLKNADKNDFDTITLSATQADDITVNLGSNITAYASEKDALADKNGVKGSIDAAAGTGLVLVVDKYFTLYKRAADDKAGNEVWEKVDLDELNHAAITVENPIEVNSQKGIWYKAVNENLGEYTVKATVSPTNDVIENKETGIATAATVTGGETVTITVRNSKIAEASESLALKQPTALDTKTYKSVIGNVTNFVGSARISITTDKADAGKTITVPLVNVETDSNGVEKEVTVAEFTITIADRAKTASIGGVEEGGTLEIEAGSVRSYDLVLDKVIDEAVIEQLVSFTPSNANLAVGFATDNNGKKVYNKVKIDASQLKADATSTVTVKCDGNKVLAFTVKTVAPTLGIKNVTSPSQSYNYVNVAFTPETLTKNVFTDASLYYEVKITPATGNTISSGTKYYYVPVANTTPDNDGNYTTAASAAQIPVNEVKEKDNKTGAYDFAVRMVAADNIETSMTYTSVASNILAGSEAITLSASTKSPYYEDSLSLTKKTTTIYTNKEELVAVAQYSGNASYVSNASFKVYYADGSVAWDSTYDGNSVDAAGNVYVTAPRGEVLGKYTLEVIADSEPATVNGEMVHSVATLPITVKPGIDYVSVDSPSSIYLKDGKSATYTFKPVGYGGNDGKGYAKASADKKFTYEVTASNSANKDKVTISTSGKLTIAKDFAVSANKSRNNVTVTIKAVNYPNVDPVTRTIEVTKAQMEIASIELVDKDDKAVTTPVDYDKIRNDGVYVLIKDTKGNKLNYKDVTITPNKGAVYVYSTQEGKNRLWVEYGKAPKSVTIKAVAKDGGKKSKSVKFTLGYKTDGVLTGRVSGGTTCVEASANNYVITGNGKLIDFWVFNGLNPARKDAYNYTVSVKGGKLIDTNKNDAYYQFQQTAATMTITLTDKTKKPNVKTVYTVTDTLFATEKAPKLTLVKGMKLYANVTGDQTLTYNVKNSVYDWAQVTLISSSKDTYATLPVTLIDLTEDITKLDLVFTETSAKTGSIKYAVTFGYKDEKTHEFIPATKPANITVKVTKSVKFTPQTSYTINVAETDGFKLVGEPGYNVTVNAVQNDNINGKSNKFATYFKVGAGNRVVLDVTEIKKLNNNKGIAIDKIDPADLSGYVVYSYTNTNGAAITGVTRVTVDLVTEAEHALWVDTPSAVSGAIVYAYGTLKDSNDKPVAIQNVVASSGDWTIKKGTSTGELIFRSTKAQVGTNEVTFKVLPVTAYNAQYDANATADKAGIEVTAVIEVLDANTATGKLDVMENAAIIDLNDDNATNAWGDKVGVYTGYTLVKDVFANVENDGTLKNISDLKITTIKNAENTEGIVASKYTTPDGKLAVQIAVNADKMTAGGAIEVPVSFGFDNSKAAETITFTVVAPTTIYSLSDAAAAVTDRLTNTNYDDTVNETIPVRKGSEVTDITAVVNDVLANEVAAAGAKLATKSTAVKYTLSTDGNECTATVVLVSVLDTKEENPVEVTCVLAKQGTKKALADLDAAKATLNTIINTYVKDESFKDDSAYTATGVDQSQYLIVTPATTRFELRTFLESKLNEYPNGAEFMIGLPVKDQNDNVLYSMTAPENWEEGTLNFRVTLTKDTVTTTVGSYTKHTNYLKYKAPTTPTPAP